VVGWDIDPARRSALSALGGMVGGGVEEVVGSCDRILLSLPTDEVAAEVLHSAEEALRAGQFILDTSTGAPEAAVVQARRLRASGVS
jgi:3-hydroxyisobutyrate dehydrogenase-like beta-hydroxyacid dehydrogenase